MPGILFWNDPCQPDGAKSEQKNIKILIKL